MFFLQLQSWVGCSHHGLLELQQDLDQPKGECRSQSRAGLGPRRWNQKGQTPFFHQLKLWCSSSPANLTKVNNPLPQEGNYAMDDDDDSSLTTISDFKLSNSTEVSQWRTFICSVNVHCAKSNINLFCSGNSTVCTKREFSVSLRN